MSRPWTIVCLASLSSTLVFAQPSEEPAQRPGAERRLELMQATIAALEASEDGFHFVSKPLLRYSDPTRGLTEQNVLLDAGLWRLGEKGRPAALVTLEIYRSADKPDVLSYEFLSFTSGKFSLAHKAEEKIKWDATGTELKLAPLADAPAPAKTESARLRQMRDLARSFKVIETVPDGTLECRLMTQPIDRYSDPQQGIVDGALFVYANATNPEGGVLLECDEKGWSYGTFRLSAAPIAFKLAGREVAAYPFFGEYGRRDGAYTSNAHPLEK